jgi:hypothetical protein
MWESTQARTRMMLVRKIVVVISYTASSVASWRQYAGSDQQTSWNVHGVLRGKSFKNVEHRRWIPPGLHHDEEAQITRHTVSFPIPHSRGTKEMIIHYRSDIDIALKNNIFIKLQQNYWDCCRSCAIYLKTEVHKFSKNLGAISKFQSPEGRH